MFRIRHLLRAFVLLTTLSVAPLANATILFQGGELPDFNIIQCTNECAGFQGGGNRSNFSRGAIQINYDHGIPVYGSPTFSSSSTLWVHAQLWSSSGYFSSHPLIYIYGSDGFPAILIQGTSTNYLTIAKQADNNGAITTLATCTAQTYVSATVFQLDFFVNYSTNGSASLYINSGSPCTYNGNTTDGVRTSLNQIAFGSAASNGNNYHFSEVIVSTTDTRAMSRFSMYPNAEGASEQWTNSSGTTPCTSILAQGNVNDANYVYTGSTGQTEECLVNHSLPTGVPWQVVGIGIALRGAIGASGPQHITPMSRENSTDYLWGSSFAPSTTFNNLTEIFQSTDPATGAAWAVSTLTDAGFNLGFQSAP